MDGRHERRSHFRGKARPGRVMPARFRAAAHSGWVTGEARNVGAGGAFIAARVVQPIGAELALELTLPTSDRRLALTAVVRWAAGDGMGVEFTVVDPSVLIELTDYFATLTA